MKRAEHNYSQSPLIAIWEVTRACDLSCDHCRIDAVRERSEHELSTGEGKRLIDSIVDLGARVLVLSGGDPLMRDDLLELISHGVSQGLKVATIPATTPHLTKDAVEALKEAGCHRIALSLDGHNPEIHDGIRGESGTYSQLINAVEWAIEAELPYQINSVISGENLEYFEDLRSFVVDLDPVFWEVFFLVPTGDGKTTGLPRAEDTRMIFKSLFETAKEVDFGVKVTEAPHYRRFCIEETYRRNGFDPDETLSNDHPPLQTSDVIQQLSDKLESKTGSIPPAEELWTGVRHRAWGINGGKGFVFISHDGNVYPSGFLPVTAGQVRLQGLKDIYQNAALLKTLRNSEDLVGRCGTCAYRAICGGSRSRAYAVDGKLHAEDPLCFYDS